MLGKKYCNQLNNPFISICIPAYNVEAFVSQTINCWLEQTYQNYEIIVVNDQSTDDTLSILSNIKSDKLKVLSVSNGGAAKARNIAYNHSIGEFIIFFDADDYIENTFLEEQIASILNIDNAIVLAEWGRFYNNDINTFKKESSGLKEFTPELWINTYWFNCNPMTNPGRALIPKKVIEKAGLWNEELTLNDDLDFFTRIFLNVDRIIINQKASLYYRSGVSGLSGVKSKKAYDSLFKSLKLSIDLVKSTTNNDKITQSCANMWQSFIYEVYPQHDELLNQAQKEINLLCPPTIKYSSGGITKFFVEIFGWKSIKKLKYKLKN